MELTGHSYDYSDSVNALSAWGLPRAHVEHGSIGEPSLAYLMRIIEAKLPPGPAKAIHVGNFVGVSLCYLAAALTRHDAASIIVSIDPNLPHRGISHPQDYVMRLLSRYGLQSNVMVVAGYTLEKCISNDGTNFGYDPHTKYFEEHAAEMQLANLQLICGQTFDLAVIDGTHDGKYLRREIAALDCLLKLGGVLALDDVNQSWPAVKEVFDSVDRKGYVLLGSDSRVGLLQKHSNLPHQNMLRDTAPQVHPPSAGMAKTVDVVVAKYKEDISWVHRLAALDPSLRFFIYDKSDTPEPGTIPLPNEGREAQTYLHHICSNYDSLADVTVFCQGRPFDHCHNFVERLPNIRQEITVENGIGWVNYGSVVCSNGLGQPQHGGQGIPVENALRQLFPSIKQGPAHYYFPTGACFGTTRQSIRQYDLDFFERMLSLGYDGWDVQLPGWGRSITWRENPTGQACSWEMGFVFERLWAFIFCADHSRSIPWVNWAISEGIDSSTLPAQLP